MDGSQGVTPTLGWRPRKGSHPPAAFLCFLATQLAAERAAAAAVWSPPTERGARGVMGAGHSRVRAQPRRENQMHISALWRMSLVRGVRWLRKGTFGRLQRMILTEDRYIIIV